MHPYANQIQPVLAKMLGDYRHKYHYSQERMSENLRISPRSYSDLELGKNNFSGPSLLFFFLTMDDADRFLALQELRAAIIRIDEEWDFTQPFPHIDERLGMR